MLTALWSGVGGKMADRWAELLLTPALAFWLGGVLAYIAGHGGFGGGSGSGTAALVRLWTGTVGTSGTVPQVFTVLLALLLVTGCSKFAETLALSVVRVLEGYWPSPAERLRVRRVRRRGRRLDREAAEWRRLAAVPHRTAAEQAAFRRLNLLRSGAPADSSERMPTALGDLLRAMESRPRHRYGLDAVIVFPRLWLCLPQAARTDLAAARRALDETARLWLWSVLFLVWTVWLWWAPLVAAAGALMAYRLALSAGARLAELVQASFDVHRGAVYKGLGYRLPDEPDAERAAGMALTAFLERGPAGPSPHLVRIAQAEPEATDSEQTTEG